MRVDGVPPAPRMVEFSAPVPSVAAAMEMEDEAVWKESIELMDVVGGRIGSTSVG